MRRKKITILLVLMVLGFTRVISQEEEQTVNLLKAPASPAAHLLNFATNTIDRPTDLTALWLTLNNLTGNLTKLPNSYAVDIAPSILFKKGNLTLKSLQSTKFSDVTSQTFVISTGFKLFDDSVAKKQYYKTALGFKLMLARPQWSAATNKKFKALISLQEKLTENNDAISDEVLEKEEIKKLDAERLKLLKSSGPESSEYKAKDEEYNTLFKLLFDKASAEKNSTLKTTIKEKAKKFSIERIGWFAEVAGGFSASFPTNEFDFSMGDRSGLWLTAGKENGNGKISSLFIARYLYQPEKIFADSTGKIPTNKISTFDFGGRALFTSDDSKFTVSSEVIYRSVLNKSIINPSWRLCFNACYEIGANQQITFTFGKDFDGAIEKGGNLIAGINYFIGLGGQKLLK